jgi:hypothetical protein
MLKMAAVWTVLQLGFARGTVKERHIVSLNATRNVDLDT